MEKESHKINKILCILVIILLISCVFSQESSIGKKCSAEYTRRDCGDELICDQKSLTCAYCSDNDQCNSQRTFSVYQCKNVKKISPDGVINQGLCQHKNLFTPYLAVTDVIAYILVFIVNCVASSGGIGGAGIFVPIISFFTQFGPSYSIPISKTIFFGSSLFNFLVQFYRTHPTIKEPFTKPVIDYEAALLILPCELLGTTLGVLLNLIFPEWLIVLCMLGVIAYTIYKTSTKGYKEMKKEWPIFLNFYFPQKISESKPNNSSTDNLDYKKLEEIEDEIESKKNEKELEDNNVLKEIEISRKQELNEILKSERTFFPFIKILLMISAWVGIFLVALLRGGSHGLPSVIGIAICSWGYWLLFSLPWPVVIGFVITIGFFFYEKNLRKKQLGHKFAEGELQWTGTSLTVFPVICVIAGVLSALVGLGAGSLILPVLLELGSNASSAAATINLMILLSSSSQAIQFFIKGKIYYDYGIAYFLGGFVSAFIGQCLIGWPAHRFHLSFVLIYSIVLTLVAAFFLMGGIGIYHVVEDYEAQAYMGFKSPCH